MDPVTTVLVPLGLEAAKQTLSFFYEQAREVLKAWRANRKGDKKSPVLLDAPETVRVGPVSPLLDATPELIAQLSEAKDELEEFLHVADPLTPESLQATEQAAERIRDLLATALGTSIVVVPGKLAAGDVTVEGRRVAGSVTGVTGDVAGEVRVGDVHVVGEDVYQGGSVTGIQHGTPQD